MPSYLCELDIQWPRPQLRVCALGWTGGCQPATSLLVNCSLAPLPQSLYETPIFCPSLCRPPGSAAVLCRVSHAEVQGRAAGNSIYISAAIPAPRGASSVSGISLQAQPLALPLGTKHLLLKTLKASALQQVVQPSGRRGCRQGYF